MSSPKATKSPIAVSPSNIMHLCFKNDRKVSEVFVEFYEN